MVIYYGSNVAIEGRVVVNVVAFGANLVVKLANVATFVLKQRRSMRNQEVPKFLLGRKYMLSTVLFITVFSVIFMLVYSPFSETAWFSFGDVRSAILTSAFYLVAVAILIVSKQLMWWVQGKTVISTERYVLWLFCEFVFISLFYTCFSVIYYDFDTTGLWTIAGRSLMCVCSIMVIPYVIATLYAAYCNKREELELMQLNQAMAKEAQSLNDGHKLISLYDNRGQLRLSIDVDAIYYIESQDNYVRIFYELDDKLHNYMLRCSTKMVEERLVGTTMMRCHRSYIINTTKIKVLCNEHNQATIELNQQSIRPIPVSKSYYDSITQLIA